MCEHLVDMALVLHSTSCNDCTNNCLKPIHRNVHTNTAMLFYAFVRSNSKSLCAENLLCRHHGEQIEKWLLPPHSHGFFNNKPMYLYVRMAYFRSTIRNRLLSCVHCVCVCSGSWKSNVCSRQFECQDQLVRVLLLNIRPLHNAHVWISQLNTVDHTHTQKVDNTFYTETLMQISNGNYFNSFRLLCEWGRGGDSHSVFHHILQTRSCVAQCIYGPIEVLAMADSHCAQFTVVKVEISVYIRPTRAI